MSAATSQANNLARDTRRSRIFFWLIIAVGAVLRLANFPNLPLGFNQDEISAGYESWSLFHSGRESWGGAWPVYFSVFPSGQNVLYSYLNMPFMGLFGLTAWGTRTLEVIFALLTLPLLYATVKRWYANTSIALIAMATLAVIPWHVMLARWGLESNILPFFLLLGAYLVTRALQNPKATTIIPALIPWALSLYAYGLALVPVTGLLILGFIVFFKRVRPHWGKWLLALIPFIILAAPFALFLGKEYLHLRYPFESALPFTMPTPATSRLQDLQSNGSVFAFFGKSFNFIFFQGSNDYSAWNGLLTGSPFPSLFAWLALAEVAYLIFRAVRSRKISRDNWNIFHVWLLSTLPLLFIIPVNLNEVNSIYLPLIVLAASFIWRALKLLRLPLLKLVVALILLGLVAPQYISYFGPDYARFNASNFNPGLGQALQRVQTEAAGEPIYVSNRISLNYLQTLWYLKIDPEEFRAANPTFQDPDFKNFLFNGIETQGLKTWWFVTPTLDTPPTCAGQATRSAPDAYGWVIGKCVVSGR